MLWFGFLTLNWIYAQIFRYPADWYKSLIEIIDRELQEQV